MDISMSFEQILRKIVKEENAALLNSVKELLTKKTDFISESKPLTLKEACAYIPCSSSYLYKLTSTKMIPHAKRGGKLYFEKIELDKWLLSNKIRTVDAISEDTNMHIVEIKKSNPKKQANGK